MALTFIASAQGASEASGTTLDCNTGGSSGALNVQAGDLLVCWVKHEGTPTTIAVADTGSGNSFTFDAEDKEDHSNNDLSTSFGYVLEATADASFTGRLTLGAARTFRTIQVWQFRPDTGEVFTKDQSNSAQGSSGSINSGNITTTGDDVAVLGGYGEHVGNNSSAHQIGGVNATAVMQSQTAGANFTASWYRILSATMTNGAATCTNTDADWTGAIIAFKSESAGPDTVELTGTATAGISETDIVAGGKTIIATVTGDTYVPEISTTEISYVTTVAISSLTTFTTSFIIQLPSTSALDVMTLEYCHRSTNTGGIFGTGGSGTSWTLKHSRTFGAASTFSGHLYWRRATGNHSSESVSVSSLVNSCAAMVNVYRGCVSTGDPLAAATVVGEWNTSGNENQAGISTNIAGAMVALVVLNSPDLAVATQSSIMIGPLTERADVLATAGTDTSIAHASAIWSGTGDTSTFSWTQTNASSGSFAYAMTPVTSSPFNDARQAFINGFDSAQSESNGWDAEVKAKASVTEIVRTSDTVVTWTLGAQAAYNITAQETITGTIPGSILVGGSPIVATPTFTIDPAGAGGDAIRLLFSYDLEGLSGGRFGGRRTH